MTTSALGLSTQPIPTPPKETPAPLTSASKLPIGKSIIVFCDGTGQDGLIASSTKDEAKTLPKAVQTSPYPTNVLRLSRCIPLYTKTEPRRLQLVYYQSGVGAGDDFRGGSDFGDDYERARGTATGSKIRDAYNYIAQNYDEGDKIYLFGFSRGAYTARKVAGLICKLGLLNRREMGNFFRYWSALDQNDSNVVIKMGRVASIEFVGTWDTVGSVYEDLSAPKLNALNLLDTELPEGVKTARHALAYHENRKEFLPTPYVGFAKGRDVQQVWFPGAHSDVGGGYNEHLIADITLCWMAGEAVNAGLGLDDEFLLDCFLPTPADITPELRLHFERRRLLTVDRMKLLVNTPHHAGEVTLSNVTSDFTYHQSLWAEIREVPGGHSYRVFGAKNGEPPRKPLTAFERKYWEMCSWDRLLPLPVAKRLPATRGQSPIWKVESLPQSPPLTPPRVISQHPVQFESIDDYLGHSKPGN